jgi:hemerythrin
MNDLLCEHDVMVEIGYIEISAHNRIYRSIPKEHGMSWVCWEPYHILEHFSEIDDPKATAKYVKYQNEKRESHKSTIQSIVENNRKAGKDNIYNGLTSHEIGIYNRSLMFGENDEAFPDQDEWSAWVD